VSHRTGVVFFAFYFSMSDSTCQIYLLSARFYALLHGWKVRNILFFLFVFVSTWLAVVAHCGVKCIILYVVFWCGRFEACLSVSMCTVAVGRQSGLSPCAGPTEMQRCAGRNSNLSPGVSQPYCISGVSTALWTVDAGSYSSRLHGWQESMCKDGQLRLLFS